MEYEQLELGSRQYQTPMYVFDLDLLKVKIQEMRAIFGERIGLCFAMKANPFLVKQIEPMVDHIEICSMGEFEICRKQKIVPEKMIISGVLKEKKNLYEIMRYTQGKCIYTIESRYQLQCLEKWCRIHQKRVRIYIRLTSGNQFGVDEKELHHMIAEAKEHPFIKIHGLHFFSGTQKKSCKKIRQELEYLDTIYGKLKDQDDCSLEYLEYGPGFSVSYFEGQQDTSKQDMTETRQIIEQMNWKGKVVLEMGRAIAASCGYYLTSVRDTKQNDDIHYAILDGGIHQMNYDGQIRGMYRPQITVLPKRESDDTEKWKICGALCTVNDVLVQELEVNDLKIGDTLVFERTGAYSMTEGMQMFLSHNLPGIYLYENNSGWKMIRENQPTYLFHMGGEQRWMY